MYADDNTPYVYVLETEKVIKLLEKNVDTLLDWFSDNFLNTYENVTLKIKNETITNSCNEKLPSILLDNKFDFDEHVTSLWRKASLKLSGFARVEHNLNLAQRTSITNEFIFSQFFIAGN